MIIGDSCDGLLSVTLVVSTVTTLATIKLDSVKDFWGVGMGFAVSGGSLPCSLVVFTECIFVDDKSSFCLVLVISSLVAVPVSFTVPDDLWGFYAMSMLCHSTHT